MGTDNQRIAPHSPIRMSKVNKYRNTGLLFTTNSILLLASLIVGNYIFLSIVLFFFSVIFVYATRHNIYVLFSTLMIAYSNYGIVVYRYWAPEMMPYGEISTTTGNYDETGLRICIFLMYFLFTLTTISFKKIKVRPDMQNLQMHNNTFLVLLSCAALILIWFLYYDFSMGERSGYSPQYEYSLVFFIIGLKYAGTKKKLIFPLILLAIFYILFDFLGGQRSTGVQIAIVVALMVFNEYITPKRIVIGALLGMIVVRAVAVFRASLFTPDFTFNDIVEGMFDSWFAPDTAGSAYYTSLTYLATMDIYSLGTRLSQFGDFIATLFVVGTVGEALPYIALKHYWHMFGGILGIYMFYYLGYFGTALIGVVVAIYYRMMERIRLMVKKKDSVFYVIAIYVSATTIRWYLYAPTQLLRGVMLLSIVYYAYFLVNKFTKSISK